MTDVGDLLGLPLGDASDRVRAAGRAAPVVLKTEPPRPRHAYPPDEAWRVVRAREDGDRIELVVAPPVSGPREEPTC